MRRLNRNVRNRCFHDLARGVERRECSDSVARRFFYALLDPLPEKLPLLFERGSQKKNEQRRVTFVITIDLGGKS